MPIIKSAIKRVRQEKSRRQRNLITKTKYKILIKQFRKLIDQKNPEEAKKLLPQIQKAVDLAGKKNVLHKNNATRIKSRLTKLAERTKPTDPNAVIVKREKKVVTKKAPTPKTEKPKKEKLEKTKKAKTTKK